MSIKSQKLKNTTTYIVMVQKILEQIPHDIVNKKKFCDAFVKCYSNGETDCLEEAQKVTGFMYDDTDFCPPL